MKIRKLLPYALLVGCILPVVGCSCSPKSCTVTFDPDNGEATWSIKVKKGSFIQEPDVIPEKAAYTFKNWKNKGVAWGFGYNKVQEDMTLVAGYKASEYKITYEYDHFDSFDASKFASTYTIENKKEIRKAERKGYQLDHYIDQNGNIQDIPGNGQYYGDLQLHATWKPAEGCIEFGEYPSEYVNNPNIVAELDKITETDSHGYKTYNGEKYYFENNLYHDEFNHTISSMIIPAGTASGYFKVLPIVWQILAEDDTSYTLLSKLAITMYTFETKKIDGYYDMPCVKYLNNDFLNNYFTENEKERLLESTVNLEQYDSFKFYTIEQTITDYFYLPSVGELRMPEVNEYSIIRDYTEYAEMLAYHGNNGTRSVLTRTLYYTGYFMMYCPNEYGSGGYAVQGLRPMVKISK